MLEPSTASHPTPAASPEPVAEPTDSDGALAALKDGPRGALVVSAIAVALVLLGWLAFYFLLFIPRGSVG
jgi:hypothetical protein